MQQSLPEQKQLNETGYLYKDALQFWALHALSFTSTCQERKVWWCMNHSTLSRGILLGCGDGKQLYVSTVPETKVGYA